jgi:hypothetical protein
MFSLTVADHVRLDSDHLARNYTLHARAADRYTTVALAFRLALVSLLAVATATGVLGLMLQSRGLQMTTTVATMLALIVCAAASALGLEGRVTAHRAFARRLWLICERYRALLAEMNDALVDHASLLHRRDELTRELHAVYESGFTFDQRTYEAARLPPEPDTREAA